MFHLEFLVDFTYCFIISALNFRNNDDARIYYAFIDETSRKNIKVNIILLVYVHIFEALRSVRISLSCSKFLSLPDIKARRSREE